MAGSLVRSDAAVGLTTKELEGLCRAIDRGVVTEALAEESLAAAGLAHLATRLGALAGLPAPIARAVTAALLHERQRSSGPDLQLVWTGPEAVSASARDTATVVRELFCRAERSVLVAGYAFDHGPEILQPLHDAIGKRGVDVSLFLHVPRCPRDAKPAEHVKRWASSFLFENWRFSRRPTIYFDPRSVAPDSIVSLHAKCVVVDERLALVTSANFTDRGHGRNIELGVRIDDPRFSRRLVEQWRSAVAAGVFVSLEDIG